MLKRIFSRFLEKSPTVIATDITKQYIINLESIGASIGSKIIVSPKLSSYKKGKIFIIDFNGDVMASRAEAFANELDCIIGIADIVFIRLNSSGGIVSGYGYAASQIERLRNAKIKTVVSVDRIAASGGYMMACVADEIIAAPFAILGSIGVVAEFPNFYNALTKIGIDYRQYTAGEFKRTVSQFGLISESGENEFKRELNEMHGFFKDHVQRFRKNADINSISTGKTWTGAKALTEHLIDRVETSDEYLMSKITNYDLVKIEYVGGRSKLERKLKLSISALISDIVKDVFTKMMYDSRQFWR
jgi:serine protease SohB